MQINITKASRLKSFNHSLEFPKDNSVTKNPLNAILEARSY